ncbi:MAG: hypothetical protein QNJ46_01150 [Leptolyngbyaceae cyanobacterium MO_188.B28]|nr:hypothetical protein [Leptolyngbyaceae cyanobacterium MO_188.B28]
MAETEHQKAASDQVSEGKGDDASMATTPTEGLVSDRQNFASSMVSSPIAEARAFSGGSLQGEATVSAPAPPEPISISVEDPGQIIEQLKTVPPPQRPRFLRKRACLCPSLGQSTPAVTGRRRQKSQLRQDYLPEERGRDGTRHASGRGKSRRPLKLTNRSPRQAKSQNKRLLKAESTVKDVQAAPPAPPWNQRSRTFKPRRLRRLNSPLKWLRLQQLSAPQLLPQKPLNPPNLTEGNT